MTTCAAHVTTTQLAPDEEATLRCAIDEKYHLATHETSETIDGYTQHEAHPVEITYRWPGHYQAPGVGS